MEKVTEQDLQTLQYCWEDYKDIERYARFHDIKQDLEINYPHILAAWNNYKNAKTTFGILIKHIQP